MKKMFVIYIILCTGAVSAMGQSVDEGKETPPFSVDDSRTDKYPDNPLRTVQPPAAERISLTPPELLRYVAPAFDRREVAFGLTPGIVAIPYGERKAFPGAGGYDRAGVMLRWQLSESVLFGGGGNVGRQYGYMLKGGQNVFGVNAALDWTVSGRLQLGLHGQYVNAVGNSLLYQLNPFLNPYVGLLWEYKIRENMTVGGGVGLEYDRIKRRWMPVGKFGAKYSF